jgi:transcriptional regulator with XRE-family HTH domain
MEHPGKELKELRELAGLSQYELSNLCDIPRNRLSLFECGYCEMRDEDFEKAERVLQRVIAEKQKNFETILSRGSVAL